MKKHQPATFILFLFFLIFLYQKGFSQKTLVPDDLSYEPNIKSVLLYPTSAPQDTSTLDMRIPPIISLTESIPLRLEFDELGSDIKNYFIKVYNCNADWSISQLNSIQYLNEYNEYQISDRELSYNTRVPYVHYEINLPRVKISGNYLVIAYRNGDDQDIVLSKRFMVFENPLGIALEPKYPVVIKDRNTGQQVDFTISYGETDIINPMQNLKVVLRQNYRWDNSIRNLRPSFVDENAKSLQYYFYNNESSFKGLNEYRFIDIRSNRFKGQHVAKVTYDATKTEIILTDDMSRSMQPYSLYFDLLNGMYIVQNYESGDTEIQPDYVMTTFLLNSPKIDERVFIMGGFNNWKPDPGYEMTYNTAINKYMCTVLLKQGQYNYSYAIQPKNGKTFEEWYFEGSFNQTQNVYDLLVYYRPFGAISDHLIGYESVNYMGR